jgi:hypothetical protein
MIQKLLIVLFCLNSYYSHSQSGTVLNGLDGDKYTPKESNSKTKKKKTGSDLVGNNLISISLSHFYRQIAVISYERHLGNRFGLKVSGGYCFGKDFTESFNIHEFLNGDPNVKNLYNINDENDFAQKFNYYFDATAKIYTNVNDAFSYDISYRFYAGLSYRNYHQTFYPLNDEIMPKNQQLIPVSNVGTTLVIGQHIYRDLGFSFEYYLGLGRLSTSYNKFHRDQNTNQMTYDTNTTVRNKFLITFGLVYGFCF